MAGRGRTHRLRRAPRGLSAPIAGHPIADGPGPSRRSSRPSRSSRRRRGPLDDRRAAAAAARHLDLCSASDRPEPEIEIAAYERRAGRGRAPRPSRRSRHASRHPARAGRAHRCRHPTGAPQEPEPAPMLPALGRDAIAAGPSGPARDGSRPSRSRNPRPVEPRIDYVRAADLGAIVAPDADQRWSRPTPPVVRMPAQPPSAPSPRRPSRSGRPDARMAGAASQGAVPRSARQPRPAASRPSGPRPQSRPVAPPARSAAGTVASRRRPAVRQLRAVTVGQRAVLPPLRDEPGLIGPGASVSGACQSVMASSRTRTQAAP